MDLAPIQTRFSCKLLLYSEHNVHSSVVYLGVYYRQKTKFYNVKNQVTEIWPLFVVPTK